MLVCILGFTGCSGADHKTIEWVTASAGYAATDVAGTPITSIPVNAKGQAIVEIKTGNGPLTSNQSINGISCGTNG